MFHLARATKWWMKNVGRRGSALLFFSFLDAFYSWSLLSLPPQAKESPTFQFIDRMVPIEICAAVWGFVGLICLIFAFRRWDGIAFTLAIALFLLWGIVYVAGDVANQIYRGWVGSTIWFAFALFVLLISGWPEAPGGDKWPTQASSSPDSP